ncbi:ABC transporter ATP-binding protein [Syntrophotalea acetylenica]|jgi:ATP-binding cassette subfamily B protein|uniref:ABC transporter ATP-binding protein n=1 Tax=Syntrophotalea acetylenica TaxID=29542 RepID=UPI0009FA0FB9|nr:ABC transporter ATP-binding protein [Syntrophotalea acetylenica]MDY0261755.1 ABC transporter ATP-binding protein [Syntrophotalea acetylenica]
MRRLLFLLPYLKTYRALLLSGLVWLLLTDLLGLLIPWLIKEGIDSVQMARYGQLTTVGGLLAGAALVRFVTRSWSRYPFLHAACRLENALRHDLLNRLLAQNGSFFDRFRTGDLLSRFTNDINNLRTLAGFGLMIFVNTLAVYGMTLVVLLRMSAPLTLAALLPYPLLLLLTRYLSTRLQTASARVQMGLGQVSEALEEGISGQAVIRSSGLQALRADRFDGHNNDYLDASLSLARLRSALGPSMALIAPLSTMAIFYLGGRQVIAHRMSLGELVAFNAYLAQLAMPTLMLGWILGLVQRGAASAERLGEILGSSPPSGGQPVVAAARPPSVSLKNLCFGYNQKPVLRGLSLEVPAGSLIGIAGPTGCGKSTLLHLLAGLYPVPAGQVLIGGQDLAMLDGEAHRLRVAMVPQESRLFSGSVGENLLYATPGAQASLLKRLSRTVSLDAEVANFSEGFDTRVGEGGQALSGGQRQRVCLGRALGRGGGLWLLDDPFSHLDAATSQRIWRRLLRLLAGKTVFLVSGQASLLAAADCIAILENGRLQECGSHQQLLAEGGWYARLVEKERLQRELEGLA